MISDNDGVFLCPLMNGFVLLLSSVFEKAKNPYHFIS